MCVVCFFFSINAIREICTRCPLALENTLLQDLTQYKEHRNKGVMMASRSLISLYRELNPHSLHKKDRVSYFCFSSVSGLVWTF